MSWTDSLSQWFQEHHRKLPWRSDPAPYKVWLSEMMLQQTQVDTVLPYFDRFLKRFPTVEDLATADQQDVLKLWEGLGYYSRARNLHKAAKQVIHDLRGEFPKTYKGLQTLPGIGPYCAAAIASFAFGVPVPVVDGNVLRVFTRFWGIDDDIKQPKVRNELFERLTPFIESSDPFVFNQAIMELGALICRPKNPHCQACPLQSECVAYHTQRVDELPVKTKAKPVPHYTIGVGVIWKDNTLLIAKRKDDQMLGGLWEFPGGKQQDNESIETTIKREIKEETGLEVTVDHPYCQVQHAYSHFKITLHAYACTYISGTATPISSDEIKWITLDDIHEYPFPKANKKVIDSLIEDTHTLFSRR